MYTAFEKARNLPVVIREVDLSQREERLLVNEVRALSSSNNFNIIGAHEPCIKANTLWVVMDFMDVSASDVVKANMLTETHVAVLSRETCQALEFLHRKGIIHRDVKCSHILVNQQGHVKLGKKTPRRSLYSNSG